MLSNSGILGVRVIGNAVVIFLNPVDALMYHQSYDCHPAQFIKKVENAVEFKQLLDAINAEPEGLTS